MTSPPVEYLFDEVYVRIYYSFHRLLTERSIKSIVID